jgi:HPt (histidine-containing phosphotransfer) domain-containing protein
MPEQENYTLHVIFPDSDTDSAVSRATLEQLAQHLGVDEAAVIHRALHQLAAKLGVVNTPAYEPDDGPLTQAQLEQIRQAAGVQQPGLRITSLIR